MAVYQSSGSGGAEIDLVRVYLDEIGRFPLLAKDDEIALAQTIEQGQLAAAQLAAGAASKPLLRRQVREGEAAKQCFINSNLRLVVSVARRYHSTGLSLLDLIQEGNLGLVTAVDKFDWRRGFKFSTYAVWWIRQAIGRGMDNGERAIRLPTHVIGQLSRLQKIQHWMEEDLGSTPTIEQLAAATGLGPQLVLDLLLLASGPVSLDAPVGVDEQAGLGDLIADRTSVSPFDALASGLLPAQVASLLSLVGDQEQEILRLRYGLDRGESRTLEEVGAIVGLTRERVRQIEKRALGKLQFLTVDHDRWGWLPAC